MTEREALKLALEALETAWYHVGTFCPTDEAIELYDDARAAIKEALAQPEQEPVAITITGKLGNIFSFTGNYDLKKGDKVYTTPPQRTWVGLIADELNVIGDRMRTWNSHSLADVYVAIEAKLEEKNNG